MCYLSCCYFCKIIETKKYDPKDWEPIIKDALEPYGVGIDFIYPENLDRDWWFGIDHSFELIDWINDMKSNPQMIADFILNNDSYVSTGNDNDEDSYPVGKDTNSYYDYTKGN